MSMLVEMGGDATTASHRSKVGGAARGRRARSSGTPMCQSGLFSKSRAVSGRANGNSRLLQRCPKIRVFIHIAKKRGARRPHAPSPSPSLLQTTPRHGQTRT